MKTFFLTAFTLLAFFRAQGQITMDLALEQDEFLPNEYLRLTVKITNTSGQRLHLGADPKWLTFSIESTDGTIVAKNAEVPVVEEFDLESSQMAIKRVNLQPYFQLTRPDRYKVTATMRIKEWGLIVNSAPTHFDVIQGAELWSQNFGVMVGNSGPPESRRYSLIKASYLQKQLRLYLQVGSNDKQSIIRVTPLGPLVSFSTPEEQVDPHSYLHVLWQTGAQAFTYLLISPEGEVVSRDTYDNFNSSRPRLAIDEGGNVVVKGGVRRPKADEIPLVKAPDAVAVPPGKQ